VSIVNLSWFMHAVFPIPYQKTIPWHLLRVRERKRTRQGKARQGNTFSSDRGGRFAEKRGLLLLVVDNLASHIHVYS
jgi:hypothetical protein